MNVFSADRRGAWMRRLAGLAIVGAMAGMVSMSYAVTSMSTIGSTVSPAPPAPPGPGPSPSPGTGPAPVQATITGVVNAASYQGGTYSPGETVAIYGTNLSTTTGPVSDCGATTRTVRLQLPGLMVPACVLYVSPNQINAAFPSFNPGGASILALEDPKGSGPLAAFSLANSRLPAPGLYTRNGTGAGAVAAAFAKQTVVGITRTWVGEAVRFIDVACPGRYLSVLGTGSSNKERARTGWPTNPTSLFAGYSVQATIDGVPVAVRPVDKQSVDGYNDFHDLQLPVGPGNTPVVRTNVAVPVVIKFVKGSEVISSNTATITLLRKSTDTCAMAQ